MLTSGSLANASRAPSMMEAMLRSASARRRFGADALVFVFVLLIDSVDRHRLRAELQLREEMLRAREKRQCHQAGERSDTCGDQERAPDSRRCLWAEDCPARAGGDRGEDRDAERAADLVAGRVESGDHSAFFMTRSGED